MLKASSLVSSLHFRKFLSKRMLEFILKNCKNIKIISMSRYAYERCDKKMIELIERQGIKLIVRQNLGRPSIIERRIK
ncbi:MAG: hypothetical protein QW403_01480 [Candidatus Aenigmatarchaeota archaeon]